MSHLTAGRKATKQGASLLSSSLDSAPVATGFAFQAGRSYDCVWLNLGGGGHVRLRPSPPPTPSPPTSPPTPPFCLQQMAWLTCRSAWPRPALRGTPVSHRAGVWTRGSDIAALRRECPAAANRSPSLLFRRAPRIRPSRTCPPIGVRRHRRSCETAGGCAPSCASLSGTLCRRNAL